MIESLVAPFVARSRTGTKRMDVSPNSLPTGNPLITQL
jgi:hypothetical protein